MNNGIRFIATIVVALAATASTQAGTVLSWGPTSDLPNGVLGLTSLAVNGAEERFTNPGNGGFDVGFRMTSPNLAYTGNTGFFGTTDEPNLPNPPSPAGGNYIYFSPASGSPNTVFFEIRFYATGTNTPIDVTGLKMQLEDVERGGETREWIVGPKIISGGVAESLSFADTSIFTVPTGDWAAIINDPVTVDGESMFRAVSGFGVVGGTQAGKTMGIDLSDTPLSYFRIGTSKAGNGGSWLIGTLGEITPVPEPSTVALLGLAGLAGVAMVRRRRQG
ncbi:PEP-CTERM sorting domain-containing protein [Aeoliella sp. SH292]|uniref:PEP-CTERM sorting domain-containing protein n=1 Tax=Aeoliella sp. SH292 TaxID=3454464 RepID=UPI003F9886BE